MANIALRRDLLNLFVFGPGEGEALAIWLPDFGWFFVDACRKKWKASSVLPQVALRARLAPNDPVWGVLLTHPHEDHADGFADLVRLATPERVFVTGTTAPNRDLVQSVRAALERAARNPNDTKGRTLAKVVQSAATAICEWEDSTGTAVTAVCAGEIILQSPQLQIQCLAPTSEGIRHLLDDAIADQLSAKANHLSVVLAITFGNARIILGADLPWLEPGADPKAADVSNRLVPTGWQTVADSYPLHHQVLKVPHHGSIQALHPSLVARVGSARAWSVTPKNRSTLPRFGRQDGGVDVLLAGEDRLLLTAVPASWSIPQSRSVRFSELQRRTVSEPTGDSFVDAGDDVRPRDVDPRSTVWMFALDSTGTVLTEYRGDEALELTR